MEIKYLVFLNISGGTSPYNILWSDNDTNQQRVLSSGYYQVEVVDENLCSATEISIIQPDSLNIEISYTPKLVMRVLVFQY